MFSLSSIARFLPGSRCSLPLVAIEGRRLPHSRTLTRPLDNRDPLSLGRAQRSPPAEQGEGSATSGSCCDASMLRRDRGLFEDSLLTYTSGLSPDSGSGAVRRLRLLWRRESEPRISSRGAASRFLSVVAFTVLTHSPVAAWLRGVRARQRGDVSNWFIFDCSTDVLVSKCLNWDSWDFVLVGGGDAVVGRWCLVGVPRSAPGPHPNPLPSNGRGGCLWRMRVLLR